MNKPTVSIIINTHNRAYHLKRLLDCLFKQTYDNFEVVVVNGPSTDGTEAVLEDYKDFIRIEKCPLVNLCVSRNIGVKASAGEIIAFIDDDAVPENKKWIENAVASFTNENVGIVSGAVYRLGGMVEFEYGYFSIWGENNSVSAVTKTAIELGKEYYRGCAGGNVFFRRNCVVEAGGFDEYYAYYMDETDLCMRVQQLGYLVEYGEDMAIIHEAAKSANRKSKYHLNWDVIAKSRTYFTMKASATSEYSKEEREKRAVASCDGWKKDFKWLLSEKKITPNEYKEFLGMLEDGIRIGLSDGESCDRKLSHNIPYKPKEFKLFKQNEEKKHLNICFLCEDDIIVPRGGVPVYTKALAYGLAKKGHNVYVITRGTEAELRNVEGVNLCTVVPEKVAVDELTSLPISQNRLDFSYACFVKLQQLKKVFFIDIVESPIWDSYGMVSAYMEKDIPLVTRLQTPLKMVIETFQKEDNTDFDMLTQFESALLDKSDAIITISDCVKETIENLYEFEFSQKVYKNYLGIESETGITSTRTVNDKRLVILFVGRLERRKGIDSIVSILPEIMKKYTNLEFHFAGDCDIYDEVIGDTYKHKLIKENRGAKWLRRVRFLGKVSDEVKEQEFADCDLFISPSLYESFGIIFIEAMRHSKPVIGCNVGGMKEVIANEETGLLCEPADAESLKRCIEKMLDNQGLRLKMGQAGKDRFEKMFCEDVMCDGAVKIYEQIIAEHI